MMKPKDSWREMRVGGGVSLRSHHDETKGVDASDSRREEPRVPALVLAVEERVCREANRERVEHILFRGTRA